MSALSKNIAPGRLSIDKREVCGSPRPGEVHSQFSTRTRLSLTFGGPGEVGSGPSSGQTAWDVWATLGVADGLEPPGSELEARSFTCSATNCSRNRGPEPGPKEQHSWPS
jgi:hypothetical protein